jgi:hypothetical protein
MTNYNYAKFAEDEAPTGYDMYAAALISQAENQGGPLSDSATKWLLDLLDVNTEVKPANDRNDVLSRAVRLNGRKHISDYLDLIDRLDSKLERGLPLDLSRQQQFGLFLAGLSDEEIREVYPQVNSSDTLARYRLNFAKAVRNPRRSEPVQEAIRMVRRQAIGKIALEFTQESSAKSQSLNGVESLFTRELDIYPADYFLQPVEERFIKTGIMRAESRGLLMKHFLNTEKSLLPSERSEISRALSNIRSIVKERLAREKVEPARKTLHESVTFLASLVDAGYRVPKGRAELTNAALEQEEISDEARIKRIAEDDRKLDVAFSWLFEEQAKRTHKHSPDASEDA